MSIHIRHITSLLQPPPLLSPNGSSKPTTLSQSAHCAQNQVMLGPLQRRTWRKNGCLAAYPPPGRAALPHGSTFLGEVSRRQGRVASIDSRTCDRSLYGVRSGNVPGSTDLPAP